MNIDDPDGETGSISAETAPHAEDETELVEEPIGDEEETGGSDSVEPPTSAERSDGDEAPLDWSMDEADGEEQVDSRPGEEQSGDRAERQAEPDGAQDRTGSAQHAVDDTEPAPEDEPATEASESPAGEESPHQREDAGQAESARSENSPDQTRHEWLAKLHEVATNSSGDDSRGEHTDRTPSPDAGSRLDPPTPPDDPEDWVDLVDGGADLERSVGEQIQGGGQAVQDHSDQITRAVGKTVETAGDRAADAVPSSTAGELVDEASEKLGDVAEANSDVVAAIGQVIDVWGRLLEAVADAAQSPGVKVSAAVIGTVLGSPEAQAKIRDFTDYFDHLGYRGKHRE